MGGEVTQTNTTSTACLVASFLYVLFSVTSHIGEPTLCLLTTCSTYVCVCVCVCVIPLKTEWWESMQTEEVI